MSPESWGFIGTLVGAFVGASVSILTTKLNSSNAIQIQKNMDESLRKERYREFQRNNLLELQENLTLGIRLITRVHLEDLNNFKKTNSWRTSLLPDELDRDVGNFFRELSIKTERVDNNELRAEIINLRGVMSEFIMERTCEKIHERQSKLSKSFFELMPKLGKVLRENY